MLLLALATGCGAAAGTVACNNAGFLATQHAHADRAEVTLCGTVVRVRAIRVTRSGAHRYFFVDIGHDDRIEIDANTDLMGDFPVHDGDLATVRGEYYYDPNGREGVHWTHRTTRGSNPPGYVIVNGTRYQ